MRRLMILRHAKAEAGAAGGSDKDRRLAPRGRDDATRLGIYLARHDLTPDRVAVSTAARTRETWASLRDAFATPPETVHEDRIYNAGVEALLEEVKDAPDDSRTLMLVGHNPGMHQLALLLTASGDLDARQRLGEGFATCGLAIIDFPAAHWSDLHPGSGRLERFVTPKSLTAATD